VGRSAFTKSIWLAACLGAAALAASAPDLRVVAGQSAQGEISFAGEEDRVAVDLIAGQKLTFAAKASKKSALHPTTDVYDAAGTVQSVDAKARVVKTTSAAINNWPVPATGTYLLGIRGTAGGATGLYDLTTKAKAAPAPKFPAGAWTLANEVDEIAFDAFAGTKATITLKRGKGSKAVPRVLSVIAPDGSTVSLTGATRKSLDASDTLKSLVLPQFGRYRVRVQGSAGTVGAYLIAVSLKAPAIPKTKLDFRGASGGEATAGRITSIAITPSAPTLAVGKTTQLVAMATYADGRVRDATRVVAWGSRNPATATVANGATPGFATGVAAGGAVIQAWAGAVEAREALVLVGGATVTGVTIVPAAPSVAAGDTIALQASATLSTGAPIDATSAADWAQTGGVTTTLVGPRVTAGATTGTAQFTASIGGATSLARDVTVTAHRLERIVVAPAYKEIASGTQAFTATATFSDGSTADVTSSATWASDDLAAATMSGATATFVGAGTAGIRATLDGVTSREAVLNCGPVALTSVVVNGVANVPNGATRAFTADGTFAYGGTRDVTEAATWSSDAATKVSVETTPGLRGRATGAADSGAAQITAAVATVGGSKSGKLATAAAPAERASFFIVPRVGSIASASSAPFRVFATKSDGTLEDVSAIATWTSSNPAVATVAGGVVTAVVDGGAAISASLDGKTAHAVALVGAGRITGVTVAPPASTPLGDSAPATAFATFAQSVGGDPPARVTSAVSWYSADPVALPIGADGVVSARRVGTTKISAALASIVATEQDVVVVAPVERAMRVFPQAVHAVAGASVQLAAQVTSSDGSVVDLAAVSNWSSETTSKATVDATTGLAHAIAKGTSRITATRASSGVTDTETFATALEPPTITSVSSPPLVRGTTGNVVTINGGGLDGPGAVVTFSGTGVTADAAPIPNADGSQATVAVSVSGGAAPGPRDLNFTTTLGGVSSPAAVVVASTPPTITSISPTNIDVPASTPTDTVLTVTGTGFAAGDTFSIGSLAGVTLSNVQVQNATTMTGSVNVVSTTAKARLDVTVTQSASAGGQSATLVGALKIGPADPTVTTFTPTYAALFPHTVFGQIVGANFNSGIVASFPNSAGTVTNFSATRATQTLITFQFDLPASATAGSYDLVLQNSGDLVKTFAGRLVVAPADPTVTSFSAASLARGASNVAVEIDGTNFRSGDSVAASGTGVTFTSVVVASAEKITANASVASGATTSLRDVTVSHATNVGGRGGTLRNAFRVTDPGPTVTSCNPSRIGRTGAGGPTRRVPVTVTGTNFSVGATVSLAVSGGSGLTVVAGATSVVSDTQIAFNVDVAGAATVGNWDVTVANPASLGDSGSSGAGKLTLSSETTLTVNRVVASSGSAQGGEQVTVYGAGFVRGLVIDFGTERALGAQFIDQNTAVCTVPPPANPANASSSSNSRTASTSVDVKATLPTSANATLTGGYAYLANNTGFRIQQSFPADSSTGVAVNLKSAVVRLTDYVNTNTPHVGTSIASIGNPSPTDCAWFQSGSSFVAGQTVGFGADRRFMVFSRTGGGSLTSSATYILQSSTSVKSAAGAPLVPAKLNQTLTFDQWLFTLGTATDVTAPTVTASVPSLFATNVSTNTTVSITFSKEIDPLTVTTSSFTVTPSGGSAVAGAIAMSSDLKTITLTPYAELPTGTLFTVSASVSDLFGNAANVAPRAFTTGASADTTAPTIDSVVFEQIPANMDGSTTYVAGTDTPPAITNASQSFHLYLPRSGWTVKVAFSDTGGAGVDETTFSAKASAASGSTSANAELAGKFAVTSTGATWTVATADALTAGDNVTLTFTVKDKASTPNTSSQKVVTINVVDASANAVGGSNSPGGDLDPFNARETWVLRFDRDVYTASLSTTGSPPTAIQQVTTSAASNGIVDLEEALRISGLATANMTTDCANTANGVSVGTNAIVMRLLEERIRATLRPRFGIAEDGTRGADSADIEFLLPGEQGSLASPIVWSTSSSFSTGKAFSEMDVGGDTGPNSSQTGVYSAIGTSSYDPRNRNHEASINDGAPAGNNTGIFAINMAKSVMNVSVTGTTWGAKVLAKFQTAKGGTPIGEGSLDDDVLAGSYDRTSASTSNTQAMKDRYDAIMDAIELSALSASSVCAHEIGHSLGLVPDAGPKTGFFGNAPNSNTFTEATAAFPNTSIHLNYLGNDIMSPASSIDQRSATGTDFMKFSPFDRDYLLRRQVYDEGR